MHSCWPVSVMVATQPGLTGPVAGLLNKGRLWIWDGVSIADTSLHPFGRDLIGSKGLTEAYLPRPSILWHIFALAIVEGKADRTGRAPQSGESEHAFLLTTERHNGSPSLLAGPIVGLLNKGRLWVRAREITNMISNPRWWNLIGGKGLTEACLPLPAILWHVLALALV